MSKEYVPLHPYNPGKTGCLNCGLKANKHPKNKFLDPYGAEEGETYNPEGLSSFQLADIRQKLGRRGLDFRIEKENLIIIRR